MRAIFPSMLAALACGAALGTWDAFSELLARSGTNLGSASVMFLFAFVAYALVCGMATLGCAWLVWRVGRVEWIPGGHLGVAVSIGLMFALFPSAAVISLHVARLWWLIPLCALSGVTLGIVAFWLTRRLPSLQQPATWAFGSVAGLLLGLSFIALQMRSGTLAVIVAAVVVVTLAVCWLASTFGSKHARWGRVAITANACLLLATAALPAASGFLRQAGSKATSGAGVNVLLVSIDTLRADRLGAYGRPAAYTPSIDAFAQSALLFENAGSPAPLTGPSHTTMLTGLYPFHHRASTNGVPVDPRVTTISQVLSDAGYESAGFISGIPLTDEWLRLAGRFDHYDEDLGWRLGHGPLSGLALMRLYRTAVFVYLGRRVYEERRAEDTTSAALDWLQRRHDRPFFLFVHYYDPHRPYAPSSTREALHDPGYAGKWHRFGDLGEAATREILASPREREHAEALYAAEISDTDVQVGRLLRQIEALGLADDTLIVLTADHGESMTEHDSFFTHGVLLHEPAMHVPLVIRFPRGEYAGTRTSEYVHLVDLAPTILDVVGVEAEELHFDGRSLLPLLEGREVGHPRIGFGAVYSSQPDVFSRYYVRAGNYKLIWTFDYRRFFSQRPGFEELFDLSADPGELRNLVGEDPPMLESLRTQLRAWIAEETTRPTTPSAGLRERLRALGYH